MRSSKNNLSLIKGGLSENLSKTYFKVLARKMGWPFLIVIAVAIAYGASMSYINHQYILFPYVVLILALAKTTMIVVATLKQLSKVVKVCHSLSQLMFTFGMLILITIFSFATDYTCLFENSSTAFEGNLLSSASYWQNLYQFFYFSVVTFSTLGYGDIMPASNFARLFVMLEIFVSFIIIVFALTNIKKIHINE